MGTPAQSVERMKSELAPAAEQSIRHQDLRDLTTSAKAVDHDLVGARGGESVLRTLKLG